MSQLNHGTGHDSWLQSAPNRSMSVDSSLSTFGDGGVGGTGQKRNILMLTFCMFAPAAIALWSSSDVLDATHEITERTQEEHLPFHGDIRKKPPGHAWRNGFDISQSAVLNNKLIFVAAPREGIRGLRRPNIAVATEASGLEPDERVIGVSVDGVARAYPLRILCRHEVVNDQIHDTPIAVTYCVLSNSSAVFDRRVGSDVVEFGVSGLVYNSNTLLFNRSDRRDREYLWSQILGERVTGPEPLESLRTLPLTVTTWSDWLARYPETEVLMPPADRHHRYKSFAYQQYFENDNLIFPVNSECVTRKFAKKTPVLGVWHGEVARAYPLSEFEGLTEKLTLPQTLDQLSYTLEYDPATKSLNVVSSDGGLERMYVFWFTWNAYRPQSDVFSLSTHLANVDESRIAAEPTAVK